jgi:hypothetical protein
MSYLAKKSSNVQGLINYVINNNAANSNLGWNLYADAAGSQPVDGTGGTANITFNRDITTPLREAADFLLVKDAANRQGQGVSYDFSIHNSDLNKTIIITADYEVVSGTFATGDLAFYIIQDPTGTPTVVQPSGYQVITSATGTKLRFTASFTTSSTITSYRLCIHVATTSASAYSLAFDRFSVGPQLAQAGIILTDWQDYPSVAAGTLITATTTSPTFGTVTLNKAIWRRVGSNMEICWHFSMTTLGTSGTGAYLFNLPPNYLINTTLAPVNTSLTAGGYAVKVGTINIVEGGTNIFKGWLSPYSTTALKGIFDSFSEGVTQIWNSTSGAPFDSIGGLTCSFTISVPIQGWSTGV